jgi:hypothetical protein
MRLYVMLFGKYESHAGEVRYKWSFGKGSDGSYAIPNSAFVHQ